MSEKTSIISHAPHARVNVLREEYLAICKNSKHPHCCALLLNLFEHWTNFKWEAYWKAREDKKAIPLVWIFLTQKAISADLMELYGEKTIALAIEWLIEQKFLKRRFNPRKKNDRTLQYLLMTNRVQVAVYKWAISKDAPDKVAVAARALGWQNLPAFGKNTTSLRKNTETLPQVPFTDAGLNANTFVAKNATGDISNSKETPTPQPSKTKTKDPTPHGGGNPPPRKKGKRDPMFDAVAAHIFGITSDEELKAMQETEKVSPRIGAIVSWLNRKKDYIPYGAKGKKYVGYISAPAQPEHVKKFAAWYRANNKTASMVTDGEKYVTYWRQWASTQRKQQQPRPAPPAQPAVTYTSEQIEQRRRDLQAAKQGVQS